MRSECRLCAAKGCGVRLSASAGSLFAVGYGAVAVAVDLNVGCAVGCSCGSRKGGTIERYDASANRWQCLRAEDGDSASAICLPFSPALLAQSGEQSGSVGH